MDNRYDYAQHLGITSPKIGKLEPHWSFWLDKHESCPFSWIYEYLHQQPSTHRSHRRLAGNTVTPFDYGTCPCHAAVQRSRDLMSVQRAATLAQSDQTAVAVNRSSNIVWTGKAADLFRSRLSRTAQYSASLAQDMETTHRLAWGSS